MKVFYIAGPYRAPTIHQIKRNIHNAEAIAMQIWENGHVAFCPHTNTAFFDGLADDQHFLSGTLEMLSRCDALIPVPNWRGSAGTREEILYCYENQIPVYQDITAVKKDQPLTERELLCWLG